MLEGSDLAAVMTVMNVLSETIHLLKISLSQALMTAHSSTPLLKILRPPLHSPQRCQEYLQ